MIRLNGLAKILEFLYFESFPYRKLCTMYLTVLNLPWAEVSSTTSTNAAQVKTSLERELKLEVKVVFKNMKIVTQTQNFWS